MSNLCTSAEVDLRTAFDNLSSSMQNLLDYELFVAEYKKTLSILRATIANNGNIWIATHSLDTNFGAPRFGRNKHLPIYTVQSVRVNNIEILDLRFIPGDCLWLFSPAGGNDDLIEIAGEAQNLGMPIITFTGYPGSPISSFGMTKVRLAVCGDETQEETVYQIQHILFDTICRKLEES